MTGKPFMLETREANEKDSGQEVKRPIPHSNHQLASLSSGAYNHVQPIKEHPLYFQLLELVRHVFVGSIVQIEQKTPHVRQVVLHTTKR